MIDRQGCCPEKIKYMKQKKQRKLNRLIDKMEKVKLKMEVIRDNEGQGTVRASERHEPLVDACEHLEECIHQCYEVLRMAEEVFPPKEPA